MQLSARSLEQLVVDDERSFRHVGLYSELRRVLIEDAFRFQVPVRAAGAPRPSWDRVVFLNLTFWSASEPSDVLVDDHVPADVVAHAAWHHLARKQLGSGPFSPEALFLGESIASAFDLYLVGRLLGHAPDAGFLETQVPAMAEVTEAAGLSEQGFEAMLARVAADPDRAFEDLRELLYDSATALVGVVSVTEAAATVARFADHPYATLLHHYELSNWILYARAHGVASGAGAGSGAGSATRAREVDAALRGAPVALDWLEAHWLRAPA